jgi:hypothetical protein
MMSKTMYEQCGSSRPMFFSKLNTTAFTLLSVKTGNCHAFMERMSCIIIEKYALRQLCIVRPTTYPKALGKKMSSALEHYEKHLAPVYSWMVGGIENAIARGQQELLDIGIMNSGAKYAVDLGAGFGMHSIPLAKTGLGPWKKLQLYMKLLIPFCNDSRDSICRSSVSLAEVWLTCSLGSG